MNVDKTLSSTVRSVPARNNGWLGFLFGILAIALGVVVAVAVDQFGLFSLLVVLAILGVTWAVLQPEIGMIAFILITYTQLSQVLIQFHGLPSIAQPLAGMLLLVILIRIALYGERPLGWGRAAAIMIAFICVWFLSLLIAEDYTAAQMAFVGFAKDAVGALIIVFFIQSPASLRRALWAIIVAGLFMGAISVFQYLTNSFDMAFWGFGGWEQQVSGAISRQRVTGPYANPNAFAQVMLVVIPLALDRVWHERRLFWRALAGLAAFLAVLTIFITFSRGGLLAMMFTVAIFFILRRPSFFPIVITIALVYFLLGFIPSTYAERIGTLAQFLPTQNAELLDQSFRGRLSENTAAWQMFLDHPVVGVGLGNYSLQYQNYSRLIGVDPRRTARSPASLYMEILSEQGLVGMVVFVILLIMVFGGMRRAYRQFRRSGMEREADMSLALMAGFLGYMFSAVTKNSAYSNVFWLLVGITFAAVQVAKASQLERHTKDPKPLSEEE